jgi:hypothetical protein
LLNLDDVELLHEETTTSSSVHSKRASNLISPDPSIREICQHRLVRSPSGFLAVFVSVVRDAIHKDCTCPSVYLKFASFHGRCEKRYQKEFRRSMRTKRWSVVSLSTTFTLLLFDANCVTKHQAFTIIFYPRLKYSTFNRERSNRHNQHGIVATAAAVAAQPRR